MYYLRRISNIVLDCLFFLILFYQLLLSLASWFQLPHVDRKTNQSHERDKRQSTTPASVYMGRSGNQIYTLPVGKKYPESYGFYRYFLSPRDLSCQDSMSAAACYRELSQTSLPRIPACEGRRLNKPSNSLPSLPPIYSEELLQR